MSRVTINDVCNMDYGTSRNKILDVEIVPRKLVEEIIAYCNQLRVDYSYGDEYDAYNDGAGHTAFKIQEHVESLLMDFEEEE